MTKMNIVTLDTLPFEQLIECFLKAFDGYFVTMPTDPNYYQERWKAAKVDYSKSYGIMDGSTLAGFIVHAIDTRAGVSTAYNTGTGMSPAYRGKGLMRPLYEHALKDLKSAGVVQTTLEVITKNTAGVRAYEKVGFTITRNYKCYRGHLTPTTTTTQWTSLPLSEVPWETLPDQSFYSWDNQKESLVGSQMEYFHITDEGQPIAYCILHRANQYVAQWGVWKDSPENWHLLKDFLSSQLPQLRINNVDTRLIHKINALEQFGLENHIDQYEMALTIE